MDNKCSIILFVDDEQQTLEILRQLMLSEPWECQYVFSAEEALEQLGKQSFDLVVSDVMMPGMDGIELLTEVRKLYPETVRIFLTGFSSQEEVIQALTEGCVQQVVPKPWINQEFKEVIRSALRQREQQQKQSPEFQRLINSIPLLPPLPESYSQIHNCVIGDEVDIERMALLIGQDVAISTALLHWANSALFGQRYQVDTIKKAIIVLGTDIVENLILSESINRAIACKVPDIQGFELDKFKRHSIATAIISRMLLKSLHVSDGELQDRAFIAGLLHDMGKLAAASFFSKKFAAAVQHARKNGCSLAAAETELLGTNHAELGSFLAEWWTLPPFIVNAIHWHHNPKSTPIEQDVINAVYVANLLSYRFGYGIGPESGQAEIEKEFWDRFYLTDEGLEILQKETETILQVLNNVI